MIKAGILLVIGLMLIAVISPTAGAFGDYLIRPHKLICNDYSVDIPMSWRVNHLGKCDGVVSLERRSGLLFDSRPGHQLMFISSLAKQSISIDQEETEFREAHSGKIISPLQISAAFSRCLRVDDAPEDSWIWVQCVDRMNRVELTFFGPERDLNEAASLVTLR
jgi:hypothetical protein